MSYGPRVWCFFAAIAAVAAAPSSEATAQSARLRARMPVGVARSVFLGKWELDLTRMPSTYRPLPKRVSYTFEDGGRGKMRTTVQIYDRGGGVRRNDRVSVGWSSGTGRRQHRRSRSCRR